MEAFEQTKNVGDAAFALRPIAAEFAEPEKEEAFLDRFCSKYHQLFVLFVLFFGAVWLLGVILDLRVFNNDGVEQRATLLAWRAAGVLLVLVAAIALRRARRPIVLSLIILLFNLAMATVYTCVAYEYSLVPGRSNHAMWTSVVAFIVMAGFPVQARFSALNACCYYVCAFALQAFVLEASEIVVYRMVFVFLVTGLIGYAFTNWLNRSRRRDFELSFRERAARDQALSEVARREEVEAELRKHQKQLEELVRQRTAELSVSEERFRTLAENSADAILRLNREGRVEYANAAVSRLGVEPMVCGEQSLDGDVAPNDLCLFLQHQLDEVLTKQTPVAVQRNHVVDGENKLLFDWRCIPETLDGDVQTMLASGRDITELETIRAHNRTLEVRLLKAQKLEALGTLAGGVAHDFNNILGGLLGYAELIEGQITDDDVGIKSCVDGSISAIDRATSLIEQIRVFSRDTMQPMKPIELQPVIGEGLSLIRASLPRNITLIESLEASKSVVTADPTQVHRVVINLCTNAIQAMKTEGGELEVRLAVLDVSPMLAEVYPELRPGPHVRLSISDSGCGMDEETVEHIFDPYFTTKERDEGTGLGLSVVQGIVDSHGASINVHSHLGLGTTFHVLFPITEGKGPQSSAPETLPQGSETVLVVDDDMGMLDVCARMLEKLGYQVESLTSPLEAIDRLSRDEGSSIDLMITDFKMPALTGVALADKVRELYPQLPIVLCTGYRGNVGSDETGDELRFQGKLSKPLVIRELAEILRSALDSVED